MLKNAFFVRSNNVSIVFDTPTSFNGNLTKTYFVKFNYYFCKKKKKNENKHQIIIK